MANLPSIRIKVHQWFWDSSFQVRATYSSIRGCTENSSIIDWTKSAEQKNIVNHEKKMIV